MSQSINLTVKVLVFFGTCIHTYGTDAQVLQLHCMHVGDVAGYNYLDDIVSCQMFKKL